MAVEVGQRAPSFRLPAGQGGEVSPEDYRGRSNLIVWFTKGMACAFCRTQMSQFARSGARLKEAGAEMLQVTPTKPERARFYAKNFPLPFPYLCDPDFAVHRGWGLDQRSHSLGWYAQMMLAARKFPREASDVGAPRASFTEIPALMSDTDMGLFVLDREGIVRYALADAYLNLHGVRKVPGIDELLRPLQSAPAG
jgi:peroxiredoxin